MRSSRRKHCLALFALTFLFVAMLAGDAIACPTCKSAISGSDPVSVARATGYFYSILFMMSMPFVIIGTFGSLAYFSIRKAREQQTAGDALSAADSPPLS